jgi:hypothetical protein
VISATLYIMACSTKNRVRRRLARLREPRYALGAIVGIAYFYFAFFGRMRMANSSARRRRRPSPVPAAIIPATINGPLLAGTGLLGLAALSWLVPLGSALLQFSKAETEFLFTAPLSRRQLVLYRLVRSQLSVLLGAVIFALAYPIASAGARFRGLIAIWLLLIVSGVYFTGITLWRVRPAGRPLWLRIAQAIPFAWTVGTVVLFAVGVARELWLQPVERFGQAIRVITAIAHGAPLKYLVFPFELLVRPLFADSWGRFGVALVPALAVYAVVIAWVLISDAGLDVIAERVAEQQAAAPAAKRGRKYVARPVAWRLAPFGRPEVALIWKAAVQTFRIVDRRTLLRVAVIVIWGAVTVSLAGRVRGFTQVLGTLFTFASAFAVVMGPQMMRIDLRQDLHHLELLKTLPLRAADLVRSEMLWPAVVVSAIAWFLAGLGALLGRSAFPSASTPWLISAVVSFFVIAPPLVLAQFTVHNAAALLFPAWIASGQGRPRGVDAMGQRLIMLFGTWLVLLTGLIPAAIVTAILWFAFYRFIGPWVFIPGAVSGALILLIEVLLATEALGPAYERLDITSVERAE